MQSITINFQVKHKPDDPKHLYRVAQAYFNSKGILLTDDGIIEI
jgi:hypothetical protein